MQELGFLRRMSQTWRRLTRRAARDQELILLSDLTRLLASGAPRPELLARALELIVLRLDATSGSLLRLDVAHRTASVYVVFPPDASPQVAALELARAPWHQRAIDSARPVLVRQDLSPWRMDDAERALLPRPAFTSACLIPLIAESRVLGLLTLSERRAWARAPFSPARVQFLETLSVPIAAALLRLEWEEQALRRATQVQWLYETSSALATNLDGVQMQQRLIEQIARALDASSAYFLAFDPRQDRATVANEFYGESALAIERISNLGTTYDLRRAPTALQMLLSGYSVTARADDPNADPLARELLKQNQGASVLAVPLRLAGRLMGIGVMWQNRPDRWWTQDQIHLAERLAAHAAIALQSAELFAREQRRVKQLQFIADLGTRIGAAADVDELARLIIEQLCLHSPCHEAALFLARPETGDVVCWAGSAAAQPKLVATQQRVNIQENDWLARALRAEQPLVVSEPRGDSDNILIAAPLRAGGETLGVLQVRGNREILDSFDTETLGTLATQLAAAIANARTQDIRREHAASLRTLQRLSREITASLEVEQVYHAIYRGTRELMDCDAFFIALYDEKAGMLDFAFRIDDGVVIPPERLPIGDGMTSYVIRTHRPISVGDIAQETRFAVHHWSGARQAQSLLCVPMELANRTIGALSVQCYHRHAYDESDLHMLSAFAGQAAIAINNARLFAESQRKMTQLSVLNQVGRIVSSTIEIDRLLDLIYDQVRRILPADSYYVMLLDEEQQALTVEVLVDDGERFPPHQIPLGDGFASLVIRQRAPLLLRDVPEATRQLDTKPILVGKPRPSQSWLGVPMLTSEHLLGVLAIASYQPAAFDENDQEILQSVATQAAIAIDNARHHAQVEEQARLDSLTQVLNHGYFLTRLREEVQRATETARPLSLIMLDIDHFKEYNDRYGHLAGDAILRGTVQAIRHNIKHTDLVGRWGGEEFAIALPGSDKPGARLVAERIRKTLAEMKLVDDQERPVPVPTVSQGIATFPLDANEAIALVDLADAKLYEAKGRGRDQISVAGEGT